MTAKNGDAREARQHTYFCESIYGIKHKKPFVKFTTPAGATSLLHIDEARALALNLLESAEAAEQDAMVIRWAQIDVGMNEEEACKTVFALRKFRETKQVGPDGT